MEPIFNSYKNGEITLEDVYKACERFQTKEAAFLSTCLTLITVHPSPVLLRRYDSVADVLYRESEYVYNRLYDESPRLAHKFVKQFGDQMLMNPVEFYWHYEYDDR